MTYNAGWSARGNFSSVAMPDGSIILMGGRDSTSLRNDVWRSRDNGGNWSLVTANAGWSPRDQFSSVVLPDGGILVMGGYAADGRKNDVWWSADYGSHWTLVNAHAPWQARFESSSVAIADGSIILMGGRNDSTYFNDVWQSTDHGATWTQMTPNAPWSKRSGHGAVPMPDGSIVLMGGGIGMSLTSDVWRSLDHGAAWTQVTPVNRWPARSGHSAVVMQDGTIVIMSGFADGFKCIDDTWSLTTAGSFQQNPSHTFTRGGTHMITLQANTSYGYNSQRKIGYVTVSEPVADFSGLPVSGNAPLTVYFTDKSVGASITRRIWDFGDGTTASHIDLRNFMKTYTTPGTYNVTLKVMQGSGDSSGYATLTRTNYITVNSAASFVTNITAGITPLAVSFTDTSIISAPTMWHWNFGDGSWFETTRSSERNPTHIYATAGTYTAYLTVSNRDGSSTSPGKTITVHTDSNPITPGSSQIAISRPSTGYWYFDYTLDGAIDNSFRYGESTDQIIKGDWDGDGKDGIATFRSSTGYWYFDYNLDGVVDKSFRYGGSTDRIIAGKWQGTLEGIAIFRPSTGYWYFDYNLDGVVDKSFRYGGSTDRIITGNWG
jgi:PKD repeat protein